MHLSAIIVCCSIQAGRQPVSSPPAHRQHLLGGSRSIVDGEDRPSDDHSNTAVSFFPSNSSSPLPSDLNLRGRRRIVGGVATDPGTYKFMALVYFIDSSTGEKLIMNRKQMQDIDMQMSPFIAYIMHQLCTNVISTTIGCGGCWRCFL